MTSGTIDTNEPVITVENSACEPPPWLAAAWSCARPTVIGYRSDAVQHDQRQEVVVPGRDEREQEHRDEAGPEQPESHLPEDPELAGAVDPRRLDEASGIASAAYTRMRYTPNGLTSDGMMTAHGVSVRPADENSR